MRGGDDQDIPDARQHEGGQRVVDHRFVVNREQLLADQTGEWIEPRSCPARENDSLVHLL